LGVAPVIGWAEEAFHPRTGEDRSSRQTGSKDRLGRAA
jgi:hypothetical protein